MRFTVFFLFLQTREKFRIEIHSEPIIFIPIHSEICLKPIRTHLSQSEKKF